MGFLKYTHMHVNIPTVGNPLRGNTAWISSHPHALFKMWRESTCGKSSFAVRTFTFYLHDWWVDCNFAHTKPLTYIDFPFPEVTILDLGWWRTALWGKRAPWCGRGKKNLRYPWLHHPPLHLGKILVYIWPVYNVSTELRKSEMNLPFFCFPILKFRICRTQLDRIACISLLQWDPHHLRIGFRDAMHDAPGKQE